MSLQEILNELRALRYEVDAQTEQMAKMQLKLDSILTKTANTEAIACDYIGDTYGKVVEIKNFVSPTPPKCPKCVFPMERGETLTKWRCYDLRCPSNECAMYYATPISEDSSAKKKQKQ